MMVLAWIIWNELNNRIFNHKASSLPALLDSILYFVTNLANNLAGSVDITILTYARKRVRFLLLILEALMLELAISCLVMVELILLLILFQELLLLKGIW